MHLVFVEERTEGRLPELAEVRDAVRRDWTNARRLESNEKFFQGLLKHYEVVVEKTDPAKAGPKIRKREMISQPRVLEQKLSQKSEDLRSLCLLRRDLVRVIFCPVSAHEVRPAYLELRQTGSRDLRCFVEGAGAWRQHATRHLRRSSHPGTTNVTTPRTLICQRCLDRTLECKTTRRIDWRTKFILPVSPPP